MEATSEVGSALRNGDDFRASLQDGRVVYVGDEQVSDVTLEPSLGPGINVMAEMFDDQTNPAYEEATTYFDEIWVRGSPAPGRRHGRWRSCSAAAG